MESECDTVRIRRALLICVAAFCLLAPPVARGTEAGSETGEAPGWLSLADLRPELLYGSRRSPFVYGAPSTVDGPLADRTQLTGDWAGARRWAAERGIFFDVLSMTVPQGLVSGANGSEVSQHFDLFLTLDAGRLGLWPGGQLHLSAHSKIGGAMNNETGTLVPTNAGRIFPVLDDGDFIYPTGYYLVQGLHPTLGVTVGKLTPSSYGDQNVFANVYRHQFQSAGLNNNPMLGQYSSPSTWAAFMLWRPLSWLTVSSGVLDPNGSADNFAEDFFDDVTFALRANVDYEIADLPGHLRTGFMMNFADAVELNDPIEVIGDGIDLEFQFRTVSDSWMVNINFDQYLWVLPNDTAPAVDHPRGFGLFGRVGTGPSDRNFTDRFIAAGLGARGVMRPRPYDQFGIGFYRLDISGAFKTWARQFPSVLALFPSGDLRDEMAVEAYYTFALTAAVQLSFDVQDLMDPLFETEDEVLLGGRLQLNL